jgi:hypothetical protein
MPRVRKTFFIIKRMDMPNLLQRSLMLLLVFPCLYNVQQTGITGVWYFDRFGGPHGEVSESAETVKGNQVNKGLVFTFRNDGKLVTSKPGKPDQGSATVNYQVFYQRNEIVIGRDTMRIMLLTKEILELYPKNESRPALFLKRSKDGKTAMSAP